MRPEPAVVTNCLLRLAEDGVSRSHTLVDCPGPRRGRNRLTRDPGLGLRNHVDARTLAAARVPLMGKCRWSKDDSSECSSSHDGANSSTHPQPSLPPG